MTRGLKLYVEAVESDLIAAIEAGNRTGLCIAQDPHGMSPIRPILSTGDPSGVQVKFAARRYYRQETPLGSKCIRGPSDNYRQETPLGVQRQETPLGSKCIRG